MCCRSNSRAAWLLALAVLALPALANAQATRTWISGVGDDGNPCSRTAPCKTLAGAIGKTATGGEIDALDPAGFGGVTLTKAITIDGGPGVASTLVGGSNGIVVDAGPTAVVTIRNFSVNGLGETVNPGLNGIKFISGGALILDNVTIFDNTLDGLTFAPPANATLTMRHVRISDSGQAAIDIAPATGAQVVAMLSDVRLVSSTYGVLIGGQSAVTVYKSSIAGASTAAVSATVNDASNADVNLDQVVLSGNAIAFEALAPNGGSAVLRLTKNMALDQTGVLIHHDASSQVLTFGDNRFLGSNGGALCNDTLGLSPTTLVDGTVGEAYNATLAPTGTAGNVTLAVSAGSLPPGIALTSGGFSGTPTASGNFAFTITATDSTTCGVSVNYTLNVAAGPSPTTVGKTSGPSGPTPAKASGTGASGKVACGCGGASQAPDVALLALATLLLWRRRR